MSIQQNFPAISPSLSLNFARSKTLDPRITFTRTSSATRTNETGLVEVVPANAPRFDHSYDPVSGSVRSLGLLVEEQRSNLITYSEDFNDASWGKNDVTVDSNLTISPSGELTADKIVENTANNIHYISKSSTGITQGNSQTFSFYVKAAERTIIRFENIQGAGRRVFVDLLTGTITNATSIGTGGLDSFSESVINVGNGWWRIISTIDPTVGASSSVMTIMLVISGTNITYTGDGTSGIYVWGAQLEQGSFPTSYIPTTTSTVTRTADNASMVGENFSSWYNQSEGTIHMRTSSAEGPQSGFPRILMLTPNNSNSQNNCIQFYWSNGNTIMGYALWEGGIARYISNKNVLVTNGKQNITFSYDANVGIVTSSVDGTLLSNGISNDFAMPTLERISIGSINGIAHGPRTIVEGLSFYPRRLTDAQLQTLTR